MRQPAPRPGPSSPPSPRGPRRVGLLLAFAAALAVGCVEPPSAALEVIRAGNVVVHSTTPDDARRLSDNTGRPLGVATRLETHGGAPVLVGCATCHSMRAPTPAGAGDTLDAFHKTVTLTHGSLQCRACHAPPLYDAFHLADGRRVDPGDVITLCSQCHGTQRRDYDHGVHGGMNGYWDRARGGRTRNVCTDCHAPHAPRFRAMWPAPGPRDRFLRGKEERHGG